MSTQTNIEWCDSTFNPWIGCTKVSPACDHCYAERSTPSRTLGVSWGPHAERRRTSVANWNLPLRWEAEAAAFLEQHGRRRRVFCASLADVFDNAVDPEWRADLWKLIVRTPSLDWLILTKRIGVVRAWPFGWPPNAWLGISVVNQEEVDRDVPKLLAIPVRTRFLSMEPLLGTVDLSPFFWGRHEAVETICQNCPRDADCECGYHTRRAMKMSSIDWVIVGGESGPDARPMHPDWVRSIRDQCAAAGVPFLFKQWGEFVSVSEVEGDGRHHSFDDGTTLRRVGKKQAGRSLDGVFHDGYPEA